MTNFEQLLRDRVREVEEESPFDPETHELLKEFKEAVWVWLLQNSEPLR